MTAADLSTYALYATAALYSGIGVGFSLRRQWGSASVLYGLALLALIGALL